MISAADQLSPEMLGPVPFDHLIVTSLRHAHAIRAKLADYGMPPERIFTLV